MIISSHYNLKSVRLIDCPPLGNLQIDFNSEMTIICGENGSGKSSLTSALVNKKWPFGGIFELEDEGDRGSFLKFIQICLLDNEPYRALDGAKLESHWLTLAEEYPEILRIASTKLCQLLRPKLGKSKFFGVPDCGDQTFQILPGGEYRPLVAAGQGLLTFKIQNSLTYPDISYLFDAAGERLIVHLAGILAAREYFGIKFPIIFDSFFEFLDRDLFIGVISVLKNLDDQLIILASPRSVEVLKEMFNNNLECIILQGC